MSHLFNLLIFSFTCFFLYYLVRALKPEYHWSIAFVITALFAVHPIHTEAVASIKNRDELLALFFVLASSLQALKAIDKNRFLFLAFSASFYVLAILSKLSAIPAAVIIPSLIVLFRSAPIGKVALLSTSMAFCAVFILPLILLGHRALVFMGIVSFPIFLHYGLTLKLSLWPGIALIFRNVFRDISLLLSFLFRKLLALGMLIGSTIARSFARVSSALVSRFFILLLIPVLIGIVLIGSVYPMWLVYYMVPALTVLFLAAPRYRGIYGILAMAILLYYFQFMGKDTGVFIVYIVFTHFVFFFKRLRISNNAAILSSVLVFVSLMILLPSELYLFVLTAAIGYYLVLFVKHLRVVQIIAVVMALVGSAVALFYSQYEMAVTSLVLSVPIVVVLGKKSTKTLLGIDLFFLTLFVLLNSYGENQEWKFDRFTWSAVKAFEERTHHINYKETVQDAVDELVLMTKSEKPVIADSLYGLPSTVFHTSVEPGLPKVGREISYYENPVYFEKEWKRKGASILNVMLTYGKLMVLPHPLLFYYGYATIPIVGFSSWKPWLAIFIYMSLLVLGLVTIRKQPLLAFSVLWFFVFISIYSNLLAPSPGIIAERFLYLSSVGFCIFLVMTFGLIFRIDLKKPWASSRLIQIVSTVFFTSLIIAGTILTYSRNFDWKNADSLYSSGIEHLTLSCQANNIYAKFLMNKGSVTIDPIVRKSILGSSTDYFNLALGNCPFYEFVWYDLGTTYNLLDDKNQALSAFLNATRVDSSYASAFYQVGLIYAEDVKVDKAIEYQSKAISLDSSFVDPYVHLSDVYLLSGDFDSAIRLLDIARQHGVEDHRIYGTAALAHFESDDLNMAVQEMEVAYKISPNKFAVEQLISYYTILDNDSMVSHYQALLNRGF